MADVRSMLRAERASRRITHPNASYTSDGKLLCNLCSVPVKTDAAWQGHLHSTQHALRLTRQQEATAARGVEAGGKKRKASSSDSPAPGDRKRAKPVGSSPDHEDTEAAVELPSLVPDGEAAKPGDLETSLAHGASSLVKSASLIAFTTNAEDAELAAFQRDLEDMEAAMVPDSALTAATISAAPVTADELAAQAREEQSAQRGRRDEELEAEREDATKSLEDEFEEMEGLEERVRRLRERREELRKGRLVNGRSEVAVQSAGEPSNNERDGNGLHGDGNTHASDDDEEDADELDDWGFGRA